MVDFFNRRHPRISILSTLLTSFTLTYAVPIQGYENIEYQANYVNNAALIVRLEKLIEKMWKLENSQNTDKMYQIALDIKHEVETATGKVLKIDQFITNIEKELEKQGFPSGKNEFKAIKKALKKKEKKYKAYYQTIDDREAHQFEYNEQRNLYVSKKDKDKEKDKEEAHEVEVPATLIFGVSMTLCGLFLMCLPIPICKEWGVYMFRTGLTTTGGSLCITYDQNKRKDKEKKED